MASPKRVPLKGVRFMAAGATHTVAATDDAVYSWGHGQYGALGHGSYEDKARRMAHRGKPVGANFVGSVHCWGLGCVRTAHSCAELQQLPHAFQSHHGSLCWGVLVP